MPWSATLKWLWPGSSDYLPERAFLGVTEMNLNQINELRAGLGLAPVAHKRADERERKARLERNRREKAERNRQVKAARASRSK